MYDRQRARHWPEWLWVTLSDQPQGASLETPPEPPEPAGLAPDEQVQDLPPEPAERALVQPQKAPAEQVQELQFAARRRRNWYKRQPSYHWPHHRRGIAWSQGRQPRTQPPPQS